MKKNTKDSIAFLGVSYSETKRKKKREEENFLSDFASCRQEHTDSLGNWMKFFLFTFLLLSLL